MVHKRVKRFVRKVFRRPTPTPTRTQSTTPQVQRQQSLPPQGPSLSGGSSRPAPKPTPRAPSRGGGGGGSAPTGRPSGAVIVTPSGKAVGTAKPPTTRPTSRGGGPIQQRKTLRKKAIRKATIERRPPRISIRKRLPTTLEIRKEKGFFVLEKPGPIKKGEELEFAIREAERIRLKLRTKIERGQKLTVKENLQLAGATASISLLGTGLAIKSLKKVPEKAVRGVANLIKNPQNIKKVPSKTLEKLISVGKEVKVGGEEFGKTLRVSPTEAIALVGTEIILFGGSGKALKVVGKLSKESSKIIKPIINKEGRPVKFIGVQEQIGDKIITKVIFSSSKKKGGVAIGISQVRGRRVGSVVFGKVGKFKFKKVKGKRRLVGFKQKGVFAGREISRVRSRRLKIVGQSQIGRIVRNIRGLTQIGLGQIATARGKTLLETGRKFGVARPVPKKVKGLKIEKFISLSAVLTNKDLSLIVGKTLKKKRDIKSFIGLIKGQSSIENVRRFSIQKQRLFKQAFLDVAGTVSASTTKGRNIIPKLSPKSRSAIISRVSKVKGVPLTIVKGKLKKITRSQVKVSQKLSQKEKSRLAQLESQVKSEQLKLRLKQRVTQKERSKLRLKQRLRSRSKQKLRQKAILVKGKSKVPKIPVRPVGKVRVLIKRRKKRRVSKKKPIKKQDAWDVFGRPLKKSKGQKQPRLVKLNKRALSKVQAQRLGSTLADTTISRTFKIKATKGKPKKPHLKTKSFKKRKFRSFRTKKGKRIGLKNTFIEKRKFLIDTTGEKRGLTLRRGLAKLRKESRTKPIKRKLAKRVTTSNQRRKQLKNLKKARAVRMKNFKRR